MELSLSALSALASQVVQLKSRIVITSPSYCHATITTPAPTDTKTSQVYTWGNGLQGQLGHGTYSNQPLPKLVAAFQWDHDLIRQCSCGSSHTACVTASGKVFTWGRTQDNRLGHGNESASVDQPLPKDIDGIRVSKVACGDFHTLAITTEGKVASWGKNHRGQCGRLPTTAAVQPTTSSQTTTVSSSFWSRSKTVPPVDVWAHRKAEAPLGVGLIEIGFPADTKIIDISCGKQHSLALSEDGIVYVWGHGGEGQLGLEGDPKDQPDQFVPVALPADNFGGKRVTQIAAGSQFSAALTEDGQLYTWGSDLYGQLGHGKESRYVSKPKLVRGILRHPVAHVACGQYHMAVVSVSGEVLTWGYGREGQLGHGEKTDLSIPTMVEQLGTSNTSVACGGGHTAVIQTVGNVTSVWVFGRGREGQLGRANHLRSIVAYRLDPVEVEMFKTSGLKVTAVDCGQDHTLAVCTSSTA